MSDTLKSNNGRFTLTMQDDGNVVAYDRGVPYWATNTFPPAPPTPPPSTVTDTWPRFGASYYTSLTDPRCDYADFAKRLRDAGCDYTRVWLLDAWAIGNYGTGMYDGFVPWMKGTDGRYDLWTLDPRYFARLRSYVEAMNLNGVLPQLSGLELYTWSNRKQGMLWVPDAAIQPFRKNIQGLSYANDDAFERIAQPTGDDAFLWAFYEAVTHTLQGLVWCVELANEMPEKPLHERLRLAWLNGGYQGSITVNRQDDTPGQYDNMKIGRSYDRIAFHGKESLAYLDEVYPDEPRFKTFRDFYNLGSYSPANIVFSSDGCRKSTNPDDAYDYDALGKVFEDALYREFSIEHQSRIKLRGFTEGRIDLNDLETDWLLSLRR